MSALLCSHCHCPAVRQPYTLRSEQDNVSEAANLLNLCWWPSGRPGPGGRLCQPGYSSHEGQGGSCHQQLGSDRLAGSQHRAPGELPSKGTSMTRVQTPCPGRGQESCHTTLSTCWATVPFPSPIPHGTCWVTRRPRPWHVHRSHAVRVAGTSGQLSPCVWR